MGLAKNRGDLHRKTGPEKGTPEYLERLKTASQKNRAYYEKSRNPSAEA